jgi:hypothetical protein
MTALVQEVIERVQTLPEKKQSEIWDMVSTLINIISNEEDDDEITAYIDNDLTNEERTIMADARKKHKEHPEESVNLEDFMAEHGITNEKLEKLPSVSMVYR